MMASSAVRYGASGRQMEVGPHAAERLLSVRQSAENAGDNEAGSNQNTQRIMEIRKTGLSGILLGNSSSRDTISLASEPDLPTNPTTTMVAELGHQMNLSGARDAAPTMVGTPDFITVEPKKLISKVATNPTTTMAAELGHQMNLSGARDAAPTMVGKPDLVTVEPKRLISKVAVAQWTDEQLLELFSDYQDDVGLVHHTI